jgi:hypothetical protein
MKPEAVPPTSDDMVNDVDKAQAPTTMPVTSAVRFCSTSWTLGSENKKALVRSPTPYAHISSTAKSLKTHASSAAASSVEGLASVASSSSHQDGVTKATEESISANSAATAYTTDASGRTEKRPSASIIISGRRKKRALNK